MVEKIDPRMLLGMNEATTTTSGKKETNALPAERDASIDELDLEHAIPHLPEHGSLRSLAHVRNPLAGARDTLSHPCRFACHRHDPPQRQ